MVDVVVCLMVSLLEADHAVHAVVGELAVVFGAQRLHLNLYVAEVALGYADSLAEVGCAGLCGVLARDDEDILKRSQTLDGPELVLYLCRGEDHSPHGVLAVEGAVDAAVGAGVGTGGQYAEVHRGLGRAIRPADNGLGCRGFYPHTVQVRLCILGGNACVYQAQGWR